MKNARGVKNINRHMFLFLKSTLYFWSCWCIVIFSGMSADDHKYTKNFKTSETYLKNLWFRFVTTAFVTLPSQLSLARTFSLSIFYFVIFFIFHKYYFLFVSCFIPFYLLNSCNSISTNFHQASKNIILCMKNLNFDSCGITITMMFHNDYCTVIFF